MPTNRRRRPIRRRGFRGTLDSWQALYLVEGWTFVAEAELDEETLRDAWETYRKDLLAWWTAHRPGTRPHAWWIVDAPRHGERLLTEDGGKQQRESQRQFLERHGLLTDLERALLADPTFKLCDNYRPLFKALGLPDA